MDSITIPYIVKGIIKNYKLDSEEKVIQFLRTLYPVGITIEVHEARGKFRVIVYTDLARIYSEEFDVSRLEVFVEKLKRLGFIHVATDYIHSCAPFQRIVFIKPLFADKEKLREVFSDV